MIGHYARIAAGEYSEFRRLIADLPKRFERWCHLQQSRKDHDRLEWQHWEGNDIDIHPAKFLEWCVDLRRAPSLQTIDDYAFAIGTKKHPDTPDPPPLKIPDRT